MGDVARPGVSNTFTARQTIDVDGEGLLVDAREHTGSSHPFGIRVGPSGGQVAFQLHKGDDNLAFASFGYNIGGTEKPGLALGPGGSDSRDVNLYRESSTVLRTDDTFQAAVLV